MKRNGISLMEVLASTFVIGVGLLGVLAVIPFGAHQVSKARDAEHCANMLDAAAKDLAGTGMAQMHTWKTRWGTGEVYPYVISNQSYQANGNQIDGISYFQNNTDQKRKYYNCRFYLMVDPFDVPATNISVDAYGTPHVRKVGNDFTNLTLWQERMRGQDDLTYTTHPNKRTDFSNTNNRALSSGKYTWFFMFRPSFDGTSDVDLDGDGTPDSPGSVHSGAYYEDVVSTATVDLLACYNRVPGEGRTFYARYVPPNVGTDDYEPYERGARITVRSTSAAALDLTDVKYVFVSWAEFRSGSTTMEYAEGAWCKIVNIGEIENANSTISIPENNSSVVTTHHRDIIVTGALPETISMPSTNSAAIRVLAIPGILYHKQIESVPIR